MRIPLIYAHNSVKIGDIRVEFARAGLADEDHGDVVYFSHFSCLISEFITYKIKITHTLVTDVKWL